MDYPKLDNDFFNQFKPAEDWLTQEFAQHGKLYHQGFAPLYQWEEMTYIACADLELVPADPLSPQQLIVLADTTHLSAYWQKFCVKFTQTNQQSLQAPPPPPPPHAAENVKSLSQKPTLPPSLRPELVQELGSKLNHSLYAGYMSPYEGAMYFKIHQDRAMLVEVAGRGTEVVTPSQINESLLLSEPGPLRIVNRTLKEYHGPTYNCPALENYFTKVLHLDYPNSMTLVPLLQDHKLTALYLTWSSAPHLSLDLLKKLHEQIIKTIISTIESEPILKIS